MFRFSVCRLTTGAKDAEGGGISAVFSLLGLEVASRGCLEAGRLEFALLAAGAGVTEVPLDSPIVMRINSVKTPSSLYVNCIGLDGLEYSALTKVLVIPAWAMIDLKSLTLMTM